MMVADVTEIISERRRLARYIIAVVCSSVLIVAATVVGGGENPRVLYLCILLAICATPLLYVERLNGPYSLLYIFMAVYFVFFGAADLIDLLLVRGNGSSAGLLSLAEIAILAGGSLVVLGYRRAIGWGGREPQKIGADAPVKDWPPRTVLVIGLILWAIGAECQWLWQVKILKRAFEQIEGVGPWALTAVTAGRLVHPLGLAMLAYAFVRSRNKRSAPLMILIISLEFLLGFLEDSKELAIRAGIMVMMAKYFLDGRIPKSWLVTALLVAVVSFPIFQAYRYEVLGGRGEDRAAAAQNLSKNLDRAVNSSQLNSGDSNFSSFSFLGRISFKPTIEIVISRVGSVAPFQHGQTITPLFSAFLPRLFFPDKANSSVGQLFNRQLRITGTDDTYISPTILGELYWNFGWPGIIVGAALFGVMLGIINRRCDLSERSSVTRFLTLIISLYLFCVRFEDGIALNFVLWFRSLAAIGILHLVFARAPSTPGKSEPISKSSGGAPLDEVPTKSFPNLLR